MIEMKIKESDRDHSAAWTKAFTLTEEQQRQLIANKLRRAQLSERDLIQRERSMIDTEE